MKARWNHLIEPVLNLAKGGLILAVGFFVFQIVQSWCDYAQGPSREIVRWVLPLALALVAVLVSTILLSIQFLDAYMSVPTAPTKGDDSPAEALANAIIEYGRKLYREARDQALVTLRNNFSMTLHILSFHEHRSQLGEIALQSAVVLKDTVAKAEILIDDIGWANYLLGRREIARKNIERGIEIAQAERTACSGASALRLALCQAKGLRHLAIIDQSEKPDDSKKHLESALSILTSLDPNALEVRRDIAQIRHAQALTASIQLGIHKDGTIRLGDAEGLKQIDEALSLVRQSSNIFATIGDKERYAKALALEVRLLEAKRSETEAKEVAAIRDRTLASSAWVRPEGIKTLTGV